jgi:hypothetical protein
VDLVELLPGVVAEVREIVGFRSIGVHDEELEI